MTGGCKEYVIKSKMVQEQWLEDLVKNGVFIAF